SPGGSLALNSLAAEPVSNLPVADLMIGDPSGVQAARLPSVSIDRRPLRGPGEVGCRRYLSIRHPSGARRAGSARVSIDKTPLRGPGEVGCRRYLSIGDLESSV